MPLFSSVPILSSAHARRFAPGDDPRIGGPHDRELDGVACVAFGVGAEIEHNRHRHRPKSAWSAASAGRSIPGMVRRASLAIAISAPVLPALTAAPASPAFTGVDREAHRSGLGTAQGLGGLLIARNDIRRNGGFRTRRAGSGAFSSASTIRASSPTSRNLKRSCRRRRQSRAFAPSRARLHHRPSHQRRYAADSCV